VAYAFAPHWKVWGGLEMIRYQNRQHASSTNFFLVRSGGALDTVVSQSQGQTFTNRYTALRLPLGVGYERSFRKWTVGLNAGFTCERIVDGRYMIIDDRTGELQKAVKTDTEGIQRLMREIALSLDAGYYLTNRTQLHLRAGTFLPVSGQAGEAHIDNRVDHFRVGLRYRL
jgi:hypothetical protein